jgi:4-hydroxybenzoate polyprenyltransferase
MAPENDRFVRWQKIAIDQLSYAVNLIFTLTIATLGYWFALLRDKDFTPGCSAKCAFLLSFFTLALSAICGLACVFNRLRDFRGTAQRARGANDAPAKDELSGLGAITWRLFYAQIVSFALGVAAIATAILLTCGSKLH